MLLTAVLACFTPSQAGQFIGSRADFVPEPMCRKLSLLCDKVRHSPRGVLKAKAKSSSCRSNPAAAITCQSAILLDSFQGLIPTVPPGPHVLTPPALRPPAARLRSPP